MTPYQAAHAAYHREEPPGIPWNVMLTHHFHSPTAWVISTPSLFVAARRVASHWTLAQLADPAVTAPHGDALHIYVAAGHLEQLLQLFPSELLGHITTLTYQRRGYRIHRMPLSRLLTGGYRAPRPSSAPSSSA